MQVRVLVEYVVRSVKFRRLTLFEFVTSNLATSVVIVSSDVVQTVLSLEGSDGSDISLDMLLSLCWTCVLG